MYTNKVRRRRWMMHMYRYISFYRHVRLAYQLPVSSTFLSQQNSHQQLTNSIFFLSDLISTSHESPAKRTTQQVVHMTPTPLFLNTYSMYITYDDDVCTYDGQEKDTMHAWPSFFCSAFFFPTYMALVRRSPAS
jgi:hypothetical protein